MLPYATLALSILLGVAGQIVLKYSTSYKSAFNISLGFLNEMFVGAALIYVISLLLYTYSLQKLPLTLAYPSVSLSYIGVALVSSYVFGTHIGPRDLAGFVLITSGVLLIASSQGFV